MIVTETIVINEKEFSRTYSSLGFLIERDGVRYAEAIDPISSGREYIETDELIPVDEEPAEEQDYIESLERLGAVVDDETRTDESN